MLKYLTEYETFGKLPIEIYTKDDYFKILNLLKKKHHIVYDSKYGDFTFTQNGEKKTVSDVMEFTLFHPETRNFPFYYTVLLFSTTYDDLTKYEVDNMPTHFLVQSGKAIDSYVFYNSKYWLTPYQIVFLADYIFGKNYDEFNNTIEIEVLPTYNKVIRFDLHWIDYWSKKIKANFAIFNAMKKSGIDNKYLSAIYKEANNINLNDISKN